MRALVRKGKLEKTSFPQKEGSGGLKEEICHRKDTGILLRSRRASKEAGGLKKTSKRLPKRGGPKRKNPLQWAKESSAFQ